MNNTNEEKIDLLLQLVKEQNSMLKEIKDRQNYLESLIKNKDILNKGNIFNFEDKIQYLNTHNYLPIDKNIVDYFNIKCNIEDDDIYSIIDNKKDLYNYIIDIIYNILMIDETKKPLFPLSGKGNLSHIYYWDNKNVTWTKIKKGDGVLRSIFTTIQSKIIRKYNEILLNKSHNTIYSSIDSGDLIFVDIHSDFDKKFTSIKKTLFSKFI
jgi:hypothetical protein|tara:strand:+ start:3260 stop:3889 length:630 start_codon:yes stop_codon:yes gene_type:complete